MPPYNFRYDPPANRPSHVVKEEQIEYGFIGILQHLKYEYRADIRDRAALERNFREKFEALNRVKLSDGEFARPLDEIVTPDVFTAAKTLRTINSFTREDGTPLNYTLGNIKDWCKNTFEVVNRLRINTDSSRHRFDVFILINGVPCVQIELKTLGINPSFLSNWFLYNLLQEMKPVFERIATGSTIKTIGLPFFKALCVSVPSLPERQRIADCLTSLDTLITAATQELETLKTHKKGLMQQLFPSAEAVEA